MSDIWYSVYDMSDDTPNIPVYVWVMVRAANGNTGYGKVDEWGTWTGDVSKPTHFRFCTYEEKHKNPYRR